MAPKPEKWRLKRIKHFYYENTANGMILYATVVKPPSTTRNLENMDQLQNTGTYLSHLPGESG